MLHCFGKGFRLDKPDRPETLNNGGVRGRLAANTKDGKTMKWDVVFSEPAAALVSNMTNGALIDIAGNISAFRKGGDISYAFIVGEVEESKDRDDQRYGRLFASDEAVKVLKVVGADAFNAMRVIVGSCNHNSPASQNYDAKDWMQWPALFVNESFEASKTLNTNEMIDIKAAEIIQARNNQNIDPQLYLIVFKFDAVTNPMPQPSQAPYTEDIKARPAPVGRPSKEIEPFKLYHVTANMVMNEKPAVKLSGSELLELTSKPLGLYKVSTGKEKTGDMPKTGQTARIRQTETIKTPASIEELARGNEPLRLYQVASHTNKNKRIKNTETDGVGQAAQTESAGTERDTAETEPVTPYPVPESNSGNDNGVEDIPDFEENNMDGQTDLTDRDSTENENETPIWTHFLKTKKYKPVSLKSRKKITPSMPFANKNHDMLKDAREKEADAAGKPDKIKAGPKAKKPVNKYEKNIDKLKPQIKIIDDKRKDNAYYILTKRERGLMKRWQYLLLAKRKEDIKIGKKKISKKNAKLKHRRRATIVPRTTQQSIPYIADYEEGLFEIEPNKYSKTYLMQDINYLVAHMDEQKSIFDMYGQFLNYFNDDANVAITIDNHVVSIAEQERGIFYPDKGDSYDIHRHEYNGILRQQIIAGRNDIKITKYVSVTIDCDTPYEAILRFHKIDAEVITNLRRIGSDGKVLATDERLAMLHDKFRKGHEGEFTVNFDFLKEQGLSSKDYIAPSSFRFERSHFMIDEEYFRCLYVSNLPNSLVDTFLSELADVEFPLVTTVNIQPLAQDKALRLIKRQLTGMEANKIESEKRAVRSGYSPETISHDLKQSLNQAETLLNEVQNNDQKMFFVTITLMVNGATLEELDEHCKVLESRARQKTCQLQAFTYQQENAFKCTLPIGVPTYGKIFVERALTTAATAIFIPFSAQELFQIGGFYYGLNQMSRNLILCDRTSMKTPSGFILGSSGSGKSFATKREQLNVLLQSDTASVIVIDPENEYGDFARAFGGVRINISMESSNYINPLDMSSEYGLDDEDETDAESRKTKALQKKSDVIMSVIQSMISVGKANDTVITPQQKTIVDRAVRRAYTDYLAHNFDPAYLPTLLDLQEELDRERGTKDGELMADGVEYYTKGSMNVFSHKTNVDYAGRFVVFNVKDLGEQLKQIALLIILDFIWNRLMTNFIAGVRTYCYVDEIHLLFQNEYSSRFLQQLYKRGRKYGLVMTGITQNMTDILATEVSRSMIANSDFLMLLNQSPEDLRILAEMLNISETQMSFVNRADAGCGLLFAEKVIVPFIDRFPTKSYLYKLMSTRFGEEYTTETVEDILNEAQRQKDAESRYSLHNSRIRINTND